MQSIRFFGVRQLGFVIVIFFAMNNLASAQKTVTFPSLDGLTITADLYENKTDAPWIVLFHQANFSRGEYRETARRIQKIGYNCLAVDLRSGNEINYVRNETAEQARLKKLPTDYLSARQDMEAAIAYVYQLNSNKPMVVMGSSYSASLSLLVAANNTKIKALIVFSPGEYFNDAPKVTPSLTQINCPMFVSGSKKEMEYIKPMFKNVNPRWITLYSPKNEGIHGSRALWPTTDGSEDCWLSLIQFFSVIM
jgi:dienelactone hydrolase